MNQPTPAEPTTAELLELIADFADPDPCELDHNGYCQAHWWFEPDRTCPHARAQKLLGEVAL